MNDYETDRSVRAPNCDVDNLLERKRAAKSRFFLKTAATTSPSCTNDARYEDPPRMIIPKLDDYRLHRL